MTEPTQDTNEIKFTDEQQKLVNKRIGEARVKAREKAEVDFKTQQAQAKAEAERVALAAKQEWQKLAVAHEARVKELEPLEAQVKDYIEAVEELLKDRVKALGDAAKKAVGALPKTLTPLDKLKWLTTNEGLFKETETPSTRVGTPAGKQKSQVDKKSLGDLGHKRLRL